MPLKPSSGFDRMWVIMRNMSHFTAIDLVQLAEVTHAQAYQYLSRLYLAGYLKKEPRKGWQGAVKWQLLKNTGPKAPKIGVTVVVMDLNTGQDFVLERAGQGSKSA